jgi:hypothetical protein
LPFEWTNDEINEIEDPEIIKEVKEYKRDLEEEWSLVSGALIIYTE